MKKFLAVAALCLTLGACSSMPASVEALAKDPSTVSLHESVVGPWGSQNLDFVRANQPNSSGAANTTNGASASVPGVTATANTGAAVNEPSK